MIKSEALNCLGVELDSSMNQIKKAYFTLVKKHPPESDPKTFQKIRTAYETLVKYKKEEKEEFFSYDVIESNITEDEAYGLILRDLVFNQYEKNFKEEFIKIDEDNKLFFV